MGTVLKSVRHVWLSHALCATTWALASLVPLNAIAGIAIWSTSSGGNDHAYELVGPSVFWNQAVAGAASRQPPAGYQQGQLVSITSASENEFIRTSFGPGAAWIGFTDEVIEGEWRWIDGTPGIWQDPRVFSSPIQTTYTDWMTGEPNNFYESGEDYVVMSLGGGSGSWNDGVGPNSGTPFFYLVEYLPAPIPEPSTYAMALAGLACGGYSMIRRRKRA
jgi:hypothetical protein